MPFYDQVAKVCNEIDQDVLVISEHGEVVTLLSTQRDKPYPDMLYDFILDNPEALLHCTFLRVGKPIEFCLTFVDPE